MIINGRTQERVNEAIAAIKNMGAIGKLSGLVADLGTAAEVAQAVSYFLTTPKLGRYMDSTTRRWQLIYLLIWRMILVGRFNDCLTWSCYLQPNL